LLSGEALLDQDYRRVAAFSGSLGLLRVPPPPLWSRLRAELLDEHLRNDDNDLDYIVRAGKLPTT
jgi:hypothetical protein